ncbi:MAG: efflux RND transporter permease subunit [Halanaerobium sp.]
MIDKITDLVLKFPKTVLIIILIITAFFAFQIYENARLETNLDKYKPEDHPEFIASEEYEELFGISDAVIVALENDSDPNGIYNPETLRKIEEISLALEKLPEVAKGDVNSLAAADNIKGSESGLELNPFYQKLPETEAEISELRSDVEANKMISSRLAAEDGSAVLIMAELKDGEIDRLELYHKIQDLVEPYRDGIENIYIAGQPVVEGTLANLMPQDMQKMIPIVIFIILFVLFLTLHSVKSTLLTMLVVLFSTIWAFGSMTYLGIPIYAVSTMIPVMLIALGVADGIHLLSHLNQEIKAHPDRSKVELIKDMQRQLWKPVVMTSVTTAAGFLSLLTSDVLPIRYFGVFTAVGVISAMFFSLIMIPAGLKIIGLPNLRRKKAKKESADKVFFHKLSELMREKRKAVVIITIIITLLAAYGASKIWIDSSMLSKFTEDEEISKADRFINQNFGGTTQLNLIFKAEENDTFKEPEYLNDIWQLQEQLEEREVIGTTYSLNDYLRRINKVMNEDQEEYNRVPDSRDLVAQYLLLYSMSGDPEDLDRLIDYDYRQLHVQLSLKSDQTQEIKSIMAEIEEFTADSSLADFEVEFAGSAYTNMIFSGLILEGQILSLVISLIGVFLLLSLLFKSFAAGFIGVLPIAVTAAVNFGIMGGLGVSLNTTTALISSIAVGMGIDYAIHLLSRYQYYGIRGFSKAETADKALNLSGRAITFNAVVVIAGFMVLTFSEFPPNRELGWLVSNALFVSLIGTLTLAVALIDLMEPKFIFNKRKDDQNEE